MESQSTVLEIEKISTSSMMLMMKPNTQFEMELKKASIKILLR